MLTHASGFHWGIILTQAPKKQLKVSVHDQEPELFPFSSVSLNAINIAEVS
jgi:hypothetical protein